MDWIVFSDEGKRRTTHLSILNAGHRGGGGERGRGGERERERMEYLERETAIVQIWSILLIQNIYSHNKTLSTTFNSLEYAAAA